MNLERFRSNLRIASLIGKGAYYSAYKLRDGLQMCPALIVEETAEATPDHAALYFEDRRYSYAEFNAECNRVAHALEALGAKSGDVIALVMDNRPEFLFTLVGANKLGVVTALINTHLKGVQLEHALKVCSPRFVLAGGEHAASVRAIADKVPETVKQTLVWSEDGSAPDRSENVVNFNETLAAASDANPGTTASQPIKQPFVYIYTSGTTGLPKAAPMTNQRFLRAAFLFGKAVLGGASSDVMYSAGLPLYHSSGTAVGWGCTMVNGGTLVLRRKFSASKFWDDCVRYDVTCFAYIGEFCRYIMATPPHPLERKHKVRKMIGAGLRPELWEKFTERFGIAEVREFYGATEGNVGVVNMDGKPGMLGRLMPGQVVVQADPESGKVLRDTEGLATKCKPGEAGVLLGQINRINSFDGYVDKRKNSTKIQTNPFGDDKDYFDTGDMVNLHEGGYISFADRMGDTFRWKGENVSTADVSIVLNGCSGVVESNVYGVQVPGADGRAGMVSLVVGEGFAVDDFAEHVAENLPGYSRPVFLRLQEKMELTGSFKYVKTGLKDEGFDPTKVKDPIFLLEDGKRYVPMTPEIYDSISTSTRRL